MLIASFVVAVVALLLAGWAVLPILLGRPKLAVGFIDAPIAFIDVDPIAQMGPGSALGATVANRSLPRIFGILGVRRSTSARLAARFDIVNAATGELVHQQVRALFIDLPGAPEGAPFSLLGSEDLAARVLLIGGSGQITFPDGSQRTLSQGSYECVITVRADDHNVEATAKRGFLVGPHGSTWESA